MSKAYRPWNVDQSMLLPPSAQEPMPPRHLTAAIEADCEVFLTNDARLQGFEGLRVEVLG